MHQYDPRYASSFYRQNPQAAALLQQAANDFRSLFQSAEQYKKAVPFLGPEFVVYSRLCGLTGYSQVRTLLPAAVDYVWRAYSRDKTTTLCILAHSAADGDAATTTFWSLVERYQPAPWENEYLLLRDRASAILTFASEYIEGVVKRELWPLLACRDIATGRSKDPLRWQTEKLGNIVSSAASLPNPLGSFLGANPLPGIALNQFRNVGAHKDFKVTRHKIVLLPTAQNVEVSINDLETALDKVGTIRMLLRLFNTIAALQDIEGLTRSGYQPSQAPEAVAINLTASLGPSGISVESVRRVGDDTEVFCSTDEDYTDRDLLFTVLRHTVELATIYSDTSENSPDSRLRVSIRKKEGSVLQASCSIQEALTVLNTPGNAEIVFEISKEGVTGTGRLKVGIRDDASPLA